MPTNFPTVSPASFAISFMENQPKSSASVVFFKGLLLAGSLLVVMLWLLRSHQSNGGRAVGTPLPPIRAAGWLNGAAPEPGELANKVLVIDAWASWCLPCRQQAPELVYLYEKYEPQGVEFIGLSPEPVEDLDRMKAFISATRIPWRNGYGAVESLTALESDALPMQWVVDRSGQIVWNLASPGSLDQAIRAALARQP